MRVFSSGAPAPGRMGSLIEAPGHSCPRAYGIFPDQGSNPCPLHWKVDSLPLDHRGSLLILLKVYFVMVYCRHSYNYIGRTIYVGMNKHRHVDIGDAASKYFLDGSAQSKHFKPLTWFNHLLCLAFSSASIQERGQLTLK